MEELFLLQRYKENEEVIRQERGPRGLVKKREDWKNSLLSKVMSDRLWFWAAAFSGSGTDCQQWGLALAAEKWLFFFFLNIYKLVFTLQGSS